MWQSSTICSPARCAAARVLHPPLPASCRLRRAHHLRSTPGVHWKVYWHTCLCPVSRMTALRAPSRTRGCAVAAAGCAAAAARGCHHGCRQEPRTASDPHPADPSLRRRHRASAGVALSRRATTHTELRRAHRASQSAAPTGATTGATTGAAQHNHRLCTAPSDATRASDGTTPSAAQSHEIHTLRCARVGVASAAMQCQHARMHAAGTPSGP